VMAVLAACSTSSSSTSSSGSTPTAHCPSADGGVATGARCSYTCTCYNYGTCNFTGALCGTGTGTCASDETLCREVCGASEQIAGYGLVNDCRMGSSSMPPVQSSSAGSSTGGTSASN
jgi:hypothetical protein